MGLNALDLVTAGKAMRGKMLQSVNIRDANLGIGQRRLEWSNDMHAKYGDAPVSTAADIGAAFLSAPIFLARTGVVMKTADETKFLSTIGNESARSALIMGSTYDPNAVSLLDKAGMMTVGAIFPAITAGAGVVGDIARSAGTLGASAGGGMAAKAAVNLTVRQIEKGVDPKSIRAADQALDIFKMASTKPPEVPFTLGQVTGHPRVISYENRFANTNTRDVHAEQADKLQEAATTFSNILQGSYGNNVHQIADDIYKGIEKTDGAMKAGRSIQWDEGVRKVQATAKVLAKASGKPVTFPIDNTVAAYTGEYERAVAPNAFGDGAIKTTVVDALREFGGVLQDAYASGKGLSPSGLMATLQGLMNGKTYIAMAAGGSKGGAGEALEQIRTRLVDAVYKDAQSAGGTAKPVADEIMALRSTYAKNSDAIRRLQNDTIVDLFGDPKVAANPESAIDAFLAKPPSAQAYGLRLLDQRAPDVAAGLRSQWIKRAIDKGRAANDTAGMSASKFNSEAFLTALLGDRALESGLMTPQTKQWAEAATKYVKIINNNAPKVVRPGTNIWPEDIVINVISQSPEFMGRAVTRVITGLNAEKLFTTPEGINALRVSANLRSVPKEAASAAALYLGALMHDDGARTQKAQETYDNAQRQGHVR
jgi:hypothetical protein